MIFSIFRFSNIVQTIHQWKDYLFNFPMMHTSQFHKMDMFCSPGSETVSLIMCGMLIACVFFRCVETFTASFMT